MSSTGHHAYQTSSIETASPEQLTLMCYDGALKFMRRAKLAMEDQDLARASEATGRAQAIINELNVTLNMDAGGEIAANLRDIYLFVNRHLMQAVIDKDPAAITQSIALIGDLRDAWAQATRVGVAAA